MSYRNARLANGFLSLDKLAGEINLEKARTVSDRGEGVERIVRLVDCSDCSSDGKPKATAEERMAAAERRRKLRAAIGRLRRAGRGSLVPVLRLIVKNGSERNRSFEKVSRATYFRHRAKLLRFFS